MRRTASVLALLLAGCGSSIPRGSDDAGSVDAGVHDAGFVDAGSVDAGQNELDAGPVDAGLRVGGGAADAGSIDAGALDAGLLDAGSIDAGQVDAGVPDAGCFVVGPTPMVIGTATSNDEFVLTLPATSLSHTQWSQAGNEALVLGVYGPQGLIGHIVLHQGADGFDYRFNLGALHTGDAVTIAVSTTLSAASATPGALICPPTLTPSAQLGSAAEGLLNAPIILWPVQKRFDDFPVMLGWSKTRKAYELYYTDENGGTCALCGGGAEGMQAEFERWGRGSDDETIFRYGGASKTWERCNATSEPYSTITPRLEGLHPILYYGDGHNRLFESRGGYGQTCGTSSDAEADGDIEGWNSNNPGNAASLDGPYVVITRLVPVDLDALGYGSYTGRREGALDHDAPWLYRLTDSELHRENKIDGTITFPMSDYLFIDVKASNVGGSGDSVCSVPRATGGFVLRAQTRDGVTHNGPQMTQDYFTGLGVGWKRIAIPLGAGYQASDVTRIVFDAYDSDGIYFLALGDAFIPRALGDNGATIESLRRGEKDVNVYVDDDLSSCVNGFNFSGPVDAGYPCVGTLEGVAP